MPAVVLSTMVPNERDEEPLQVSFKLKVKCIRFLLFCCYRDILMLAFSESKMTDQKSKIENVLESSS